MELTVLFAGPATSTLRWLLKAIKTNDSAFSIDDFQSRPSTRITVVMKTPSGEFICTLTLDFLLKMPSIDAFRLLKYDVLAYVTEDANDAVQWQLRRNTDQRGLKMYNIVIGNPIKDSVLPIGFTIEDERYGDLQQLIQAITVPAIVRKVQEIKASELKDNTTNVPEIKITEPPCEPAADDQTGYSEYNFQ